MEKVVKLKCWEYVEHLELSLIVGRNVIATITPGKMISPSTKGKHVHSQ